MKKWKYKYFRGSIEAKISRMVFLVFFRIIAGGQNSGKKATVLS